MARLESISTVRDYEKHISKMNKKVLDTDFRNSPFLLAWMSADGFRFSTGLRTILAFAW